jgi:hypothetical protein
MSNIAVIEKQIENLDDRAFSELTAWFVEYEHARWEQQIKSDSSAGKLDFLVEEALFEHKSGKTSAL